MKDTRLKILKAMGEATSRMDLNNFALSVGLTANVVMDMFRQLETEGFLRKVGAGYSLTEKGKNAL